MVVVVLSVVIAHICAYSGGYSRVARSVVGLLDMRSERSGWEISLFLPKPSCPGGLWTVGESKETKSES